jgi:3-oxoadipate enol-lactonase
VDGYVGCCTALRDADLRSAASRITAKALVITGTHDVATTPADGRWLADAIAGAALVELDSAHLSNVERAEAFNDAVLAFLHT